MATELQDTQLLANFSSGVMLAIDNIYHKQYLTELFTRYRSSVQQNESSYQLEAIELAELVLYFEDIKLTDDAIIKLFQVVDFVQVTS